MSVSKVISALTGNILGTGPAKGGNTTPIARLSQIELARSHEIDAPRGYDHKDHDHRHELKHVVNSRHGCVEGDGFFLFVLVSHCIEGVSHLDTL